MKAAWLEQICAHRLYSSPQGCGPWRKASFLDLPQRVQVRRNSQLPYAEHALHRRVAIVGSGPAGFYTARKLMRDVPGTKIDMYERLPVPFGLVRFGVAPDHPEVKNCQDEFEQVASSPDFTFVGNVQLGLDLPLPILAKHYDAIVFSYGASKDRQLGLDGEDNPHIYSARAFVGWYNGLPEYRHLDPDLTAGETAVVIGQGNVALDVARILLSNTDDLRRTDLTDYALHSLSKSKIKHVHVVGRRGPMQASFTIKELRELIQLQGVNFAPIAKDLLPPDLKKLDRPKRRIMELLQKGKPHDASASRSCRLDFLLAPHSFASSAHDFDALTGVTFNKTELADVASPSSSVKLTNEQITIPSSTLFRSIGYKAEALPGMDLIGAVFNENSGKIHHDGVGRVIAMDNSNTDPSGSPAGANASQQSAVAPDGRASLYCAGWVKRGPTGVIASTMTDAFQTAEAIVEDWRTASNLNSPGLNDRSTGWKAVKAEAEATGHDLQKVVDWDGWHRIDHTEKAAGKQAGKPREKLGSLRELEAAAAV